MPCVMSMLVLHPKTTMRSAGAFTSGVGVNVLIGTSVNVGGAMFVLVGKKVGVMVAVGWMVTGVADAFVTPMMTGVGL